MGICHICSREISRSDFAAQRAIILLRRVYCRDCADEIAAGPPAAKPASRMRRITRLVLGRREP